MCGQYAREQPIKMFKGFTLIELIVTVLIVGIIFSAGIPGLQRLLGNVALNSSADKLASSLAYARGEAVARMGDISVEAIGGAQIGWSVFIDTNADCTRVAGEEIIQVVNITADKVTIVGEDEDGVAVTCVGFNERGETRGSKAIKLTVDSAIPSSNEAIVSITVNGFTTIK